MEFQFGTGGIREMASAAAYFVFLCRMFPGKVSLTSRTKGTKRVARNFDTIGTPIVNRPGLTSCDATHHRL